MSRKSLVRVMVHGRAMFLSSVDYMINIIAIQKKQQKDWLKLPEIHIILYKIHLSPNNEFVPKPTSVLNSKGTGDVLTTCYGTGFSSRAGTQYVLTICHGIALSSRAGKAMGE